MIWYFILAFFWTIVIIYSIGLGIGIFTFGNTETIIPEKQPLKNEEVPVESQQQNSNNEQQRVNMNSMF